MPLNYTCRKPLMGVWKMDETWQEMIAALQCDKRENDCRNDELAAILSLSPDKRKQERLAVRLLLNHLLETKSGAAQITYEADGAPRLTNCAYHVSITHTTGFAAVILGERPYPGIDIEYLSGRAWRLRERFMNDDELRMFAGLESERQACEMLATLCWCAKETAFKALRQSEVDFADHLHISTLAPSTEGFLTLQETKTPLQQTFGINYRVTNEYVLTWKE